MANDMPGDAKSRLYIGLMSGTSMDAIDCAIIECADYDIQLRATREHKIPGAIRDGIHQLSQPGANEVERLGILDRQLGKLFAEAALQLTQDSGYASEKITAIGSHGQTIRHHPPSNPLTADESFTLQIGDPNTIAEITGITTVADFRRRDIAAGGEGAPLAPAFHAAVFASPGLNRAIVNIGGIANASILKGKQLTQGFDTGPGNTLLDGWVNMHRGLPYDSQGSWGAEGEVNKPLLDTLLEHPYLKQTGPRSTGKEVFNLTWLENCLSNLPRVTAQDVQATLCEYTARTIASGLTGSGEQVDEVYICGGGAHNTDLMRRLYRLLQPRTLESTSVIGLDPDWVEAAAFAWLAHQSLEGLAGNAAVVTGASGPRVLGGVFPGNGGAVPTN